MARTEARETTAALAIPKSTLGVGIIGVNPAWGWATTAHIAGDGRSVGFTITASLGSTARGHRLETFFMEASCK